MPTNLINMPTSAINDYRTFDFLFHQLENTPIKDAFNYKVDGKWMHFSTKKTIKIVNQLSLGLLKSGLKPGDKVALISENRPEWNFIDFACQQIGVIVVPLYPTISTSDYRYIFQHANVRFIFLSSGTIYKKVASAVSDLDVREILSFNNVRGCKSWKEVLDAGKGGAEESLISYREKIKPGDMATIIYTSGTTDNPKGVMLSHRNMVSNVLACEKYSSLIPGKEKALSFLPLNHVYERMGVYIYTYLGIAVYYAESMETIAENLKEIKPHTFNTVPRLLEKVYDKILRKGSELGGLKKGAFNQAIRLGLKYDPNVTQNALYKGQLELANKLVFSKWREALGGNIKQIQCGASALQPRLAKVFWAAGIKVLEGYGLTETSPVISANRLDKIKIGTVGPILDNTEIRFAPDNEIEVRGPGVMMGYYKDPEQTKQVLSEDGWLKTGDVGILDGDFLQITDRKKELFKTSGGLYIAPQQIENKLKESILIEQAMVVGENKKFPAAIITPNFDELTEFASKRFILITNFENLVKEPAVVKLFEKEISKVNSDLGRWAGVKIFRIVTDTWSPESGELTPTMKLKRRVLHEKYKELIADIYKDDGSVTFEDLEEEAEISKR